MGVPETVLCPHCLGVVPIARDEVAHVIGFTSIILGPINENDGQPGVMLLVRCFTCGARHYEYSHGDPALN